MNLELIGKTALISGSTKGIGFAIASQLAEEGALVIVNGRSESAVHSAMQQVRKAVPEANVEGFAGDLATAAATEELLKRVPAVDILVNNLGVYEPKPFDKISDEDWRHVFEEVARLVTFVCSPVASAINGAALRVDGGVVSSSF